MDCIFCFVMAQVPRNQGSEEFPPPPPPPLSPQAWITSLSHAALPLRHAGDPYV